MITAVWLAIAGALAAGGVAAYIIERHRATSTPTLQISPTSLTIAAGQTHKFDAS